MHEHALARRMWFACAGSKCVLFIAGVYARECNCDFDASEKWKVKRLLTAFGQKNHEYFVLLCCDNGSIDVLHVLGN